MIRENYPDISLFNICVVPHLTGEVILQSLNSTLTISHLYKYSDGILLLHNDEIAESCNRLLNLKRPTLPQINDLMCSSLASLLWPAVGTNPVHSTLQNNLQYVQDMVYTMLLDSRYKLMQLNHIPLMPPNSKAFSNETWPALEKRIHQMASTGTSEHNTSWSANSVRP